jgi:hypothetical protein
MQLHSSIVRTPLLALCAENRSTILRQVRAVDKQAFFNVSAHNINVVLSSEGRFARGQVYSRSLGNLVPKHDGGR